MKQIAATKQTPDTGSETGAATSARRSPFVEGTVSVIPIVVGVIPFGLAVGAASAAADVPTSAAIAGPIMILAGAAQLTAVEMLDAGAAPIAIVISALMLNARFMLYSAALAPWFRHASFTRRVVLALPVIDHMHFICTPRFRAGDLDQRQRTAFYVGTAALPVFAWVASNMAGLVIGNSVPDGVGLHVAGPLGFAGMLATSTEHRPSTIAATTAGAVAVIAVGLPLHLAVVLAPIAGVVAGTRLSGSSRDDDTARDGAPT